MILLHISHGGPTFSRGVQMLISIETHIHVTITCDFPGGGGGSGPLSTSGSANVQMSLCGLLLSLVTPNANQSIVFKRLAKALIRLRKCADWSKHLVLAHTTLLEISYFGPFIGAKNALWLYIRTKLHLPDKESVTSFIKNM